MPHVESTYRVRTKKEFRGIAGLSMGGYGSLVLSLRHPELFAATAAFSSGIVTDEDWVASRQETYDRVYGPVYGAGLEGQARLTDHRQEYSVLDIVERTSAEDLKEVRYYIDCGDDDFLAVGNATLHILLTQKEVPHQYRVRDGAHSWSYWRTGLADGLKFIGESFHR